MLKSKAMGWIIFYTFLFCIGSFLAYTGFNQFQKTQNLLKKGIQTTATVTSFITSQGDNSTMYRPVFEFMDRSQQTQSFESGISSSPASYEIGEKVNIVYTPSKIENAKVISFWGLYRGSVILSMIAAPFLIIGGSYLLYIS